MPLNPDEANETLTVATCTPESMDETTAAAFRSSLRDLRRDMGDAAFHTLGKEMLLGMSDLIKAECKPGDIA